MSKVGGIRMNQNRQLMEEIAMLFSGNQGCNFDKTGDYPLLLLIKESVQDMKKKLEESE
jgi:hypothetical protein